MGGGSGVWSVKVQQVLWPASVDVTTGVGGTCLDPR